MSVTKLAVDVLMALEERGVLKKVLDFALRKKPADILILGASGTGKTALLNKLCGKEAFIHRFSRSPDVEQETGNVEGVLLALRTTPGQMDEVHTSNRSAAIREASRSEKLGLVNVVSYGYHEGVTDTKSVFDDNHEVMQQFLERRREAELDLIPEWSDVLCGRGGNAKWLITVVTKADIWWGTSLQEEIRDYYTNGDYVKTLGPAAKLNHTVCFYSALNQKFYGILRTSGEYEDEQRNRDHNTLVTSMLTYVSKD